jgi:hypothetical protein
VPDCYFVIQTDGAGVAAPSPKDVRRVHADVKQCAKDQDGLLNKFVHDKVHKKVDTHVGYKTREEAEAALEPLVQCLERKGNVVLDSGVADTAEDLGLV